VSAFGFGGCFWACEKLFFRHAKKITPNGPGCPRQDEPGREKRSAEWSGGHWNHMRQHVCYKGHPVICFLIIIRLQY
jgi:hypothetical protein